MTPDQTSTDRVLDWHVELNRIEPELARLPSPARLAVLRLVERFRAEDAAADGPAAA